MSFIKTAFLFPKETVLHGHLQSTVSGSIYGLHKGDVNVEGRLVIGKTAAITGDVYAKMLEVYGSVYGNIFCTDRAIIYHTAIIKGDITASVIEIKEGAAVEGVIIKKADPDSAKAAGNLTEEGGPAVVEEQLPVVETVVVPEKSTDQDRGASNWF